MHGDGVDGDVEFVSDLLMTQAEDGEERDLALAQVEARGARGDDACESVGFRKSTSLAGVESG